jgi:hypothetical protein
MDKSDLMDRIMVSNLVSIKVLGLDVDQEIHSSVDYQGVGFGSRGMPVTNSILRHSIQADFKNVQCVDYDFLFFEIQIEEAVSKKG